MAFHRKRYEESLQQKYMSNPGAENRRKRKEALNARRGKRIPSARIVQDHRRSEQKKRMAKEMRDQSE